MRRIAPLVWFGSIRNAAVDHRAGLWNATRFRKKVIILFVISLAAGRRTVGGTGAASAAARYRSLAPSSQRTIGIHIFARCLAGRGFVAGSTRASCSATAATARRVSRPSSLILPVPVGRHGSLRRSLVALRPLHAPILACSPSLVGTRRRTPAILGIVRRVRSLWQRNASEGMCC